MRMLSFCFYYERRSLCGELSYYTRGIDKKVAFSKNKNKRGVALKQRSAVVLGVHYETHK